MACVYTKQFSDTTAVEPTEENTSKVIGQIIKNEKGKTIFQIIAMTEDMELAGKTKNTLVKMGYADAKDEVKQFGKSEELYYVLDKTGKFWSFDNDWTIRMDEADAWSTKEDAEKIAKKVGGEVKQFAKPNKLNNIQEDKYYILAAPNHINPDNTDCWVSSGELINRFYMGDSLPMGGFFYDSKAYDTYEDAKKVALKSGYDFGE